MYSFGIRHWLSKNLATNIAIALFHVVLLIVIWNSVIAIVRVERQDARWAALTRIQNLAVAFEQYTTRIIENGDSVNRELIREQARTGANLDILQFVADQIIDNKVVHAVAIANQRGDAGFAEKSASSINHSNIAEAEYFRVHVARDSGKVFVGKPQTDLIPGKSLIPLTRRITKPDGSFDGVVVTLIEPLIFTDFLHDAKLNPLDIISVVGLDGVMRARLKGGKVSSGDNISRGLLFAEIGRSPVGSYTGNGSIDGVPRFFSYRVVSDYELVVTVGISEAEVMAAPNQRRTRYLQAAGLASLMIAGFAILLMVGLASRKQAEEKSTRLAAIVESSEDAIIGMDLQETVTSWNHGAEKLFGYAAAEMIDQPLTRLLRPEGPEPKAGVSGQNGFGKTVPHFETVWVSKDGRRLDLSVTGSTIKANGRIVGGSLVVHNITGRKQAEAAVLASEEQLRLAVDATKLGTWDFDPVNGKRHGSDRSKEIFGLPLGESVSREQIISRVHPEDRQLMEGAIAQALLPTGTGEMHVEFRILREDGEVRWVESHGRASFENSSGTRLIGTVIDITERKLADRARQTSELGYRRLFESAKDGILILNADSGKIIDVNPYMIEMLGYSKEEFMGKELWEIGVLKDIAASKIAFNELQQQGYIRYDDMPLKSRTGVVRQVEFVSNSYLVGERRVIQCNIRDISERMRTVEELHEANQEVKRALAELQTRTHELASMTEQLWQASKLATMGELAASIAHELNNPLTTVTLSVETLMLQLGSDERYTDILTTLRDESDRMANLVGNLLQFSRRSHAQISTLNIAEELATALNLINYHLRSHNIKVVQEIAADLPTTHADRQQLLQVFLNLLTNATDAMPAGGTLTVRVRAGSLDQGRTAILIEFADTGMGIEAAALQTIWEPFVTTKPEGKGTGLGLPICRRTIEEHGGTIEVESELGLGTTFRILLPAMDTGPLRSLMEGKRHQES